VDCFNISIHSFFFFLWFFFKWSLLILFFSYWAGWEFNFVDFSKKNIVNCYSVSPTWFLFCCSVSPHVFFLNHLYWIYFFNIELVENLALAFPTCFFFLFCFFSKNCLLFFVCFFRIVLSIFFFTIELVENLVF